MDHLPDTTDLSRRRLDRRGALAWLALSGVWLSGAGRQGLAAMPAEGCLGGLQEFWIVNTRCAPAAGDLGEGINQIVFKKKSDRGKVRYDRDEFLAAIDPSLPTVVYVHGNSLDADQAVKAGQRLVDGIGPNVPAYRFILWSWPSQRVQGTNPAGNTRVKAARSESQGYYLAWMMDQIDPRTAWGLVGYSLGARAVTAALDGLARGEVAGHPLIELKHIVGRPVQATLLAAAEDNTWLWPEGRHGLALTQVDRMLVTVNPRDRALRHFMRMSPEEALGASGIPDAERLQDLRPKVREVVVTPWLGSAHRWLRYTRSAEIMSLVRPYTGRFHRTSGSRP